MVKIDTYDKLLKLERFTGSLEEYRRTKILEGIISDSAQVIPMPTKDISGYVNDPDYKFRSEHQTSQDDWSEIIELVDRGCIALVCYHEKRKSVILGMDIIEIKFPRGIPVMIQRIGGPYR